MQSISSLNTSSFARFQQGAQSNLRSHGDDNRAAVQYQERLRQRAAGDQLGPQQTERPAPAGNDNLRSSVREAMSYERSERGMLNLRTQEGDIVRLKFMSSDSIDMLSEQRTDGERTSNTFSFESSSYSRFKIAVEGDLNAEEQKAIEDVLAQAGEMADSLYGGDVQSAFAVASDFQINSEQLAKVNLRLSVQERFSYARETVTTRLAQAPAKPPVAAVDDAAQPAKPAPQATAVQPVATAAQPVEVSRPLETPQPTGAAPSVASDQVAAAPATDDLASQIESLATALGSITAFLTKLTESLESFSEQMQSDGTQSSFSFSYGFKLQMMSEMVGTLEPASQDTPAEAHSLASATIDELAAQVDASLDIEA